MGDQPICSTEFIFMGDQPFFPEPGWLLGVSSGRPHMASLVSTSRSSRRCARKAFRPTCWAVREWAQFKGMQSDILVCKGWGEAEGAVFPTRKVFVLLAGRSYCVSSVNPTPTYLYHPCLGGLWVQHQGRKAGPNQEDAPTPTLRKAGPGGMGRTPEGAFASGTAVTRAHANVNARHAYKPSNVFMT